MTGYGRRPSVVDLAMWAVGCIVGPIADCNTVDGARITSFGSDCIPRYGVISSCQSAATSKPVKHCWFQVLTHISSSIASPVPLLLPLLSGSVV